MNQPLYNKNMKLKVGDVFVLERMILIGGNIPLICSCLLKTFH